MPDMLYKYTDQAILDGISAIQKTHNNIDKDLDELESYATTQLDLWTGDARTGYLEHKQEWDKGVDKMKLIMTEQAIPALQRIVENYNLAERYNSKQWRDG